MTTKISRSRCIPCPTFEEFIKTIENLQNMGYKRLSGDKADQWRIKDLRYHKDKTLLVIRHQDGRLAVDSNKSIEDYEETSLYEIINEQYI